MVGKRSIIVQFIIVLLILTVWPASGGPVVVDVFEGGQAEIKVTFGQGGYDDSTKLSVPAKAELDSAQISVKGMGDSFGNYPTNVSIDVGNDSNIDWEFKGENYGSLGMQTELTDIIEPSSDIQWWNASWNYRTPVEVEVPSNDSALWEDVPVIYSANFTDILKVNFDKVEVAFDPNSVRVVEYDDMGNMIGEIPSQFDIDEEFDSIENAIGEVLWYLEGQWFSGELSYYYIYFDTELSPKEAPNYWDWSDLDLNTELGWYNNSNYDFRLYDNGRYGKWWDGSGRQITGLSNPVTGPADLDFATCIGDHNPNTYTYDSHAGNYFPSGSYNLTILSQGPLRTTVACFTENPVLVAGQISANVKIFRFYAFKDYFIFENYVYTDNATKVANLINLYLDFPADLNNGYGQSAVLGNVTDYFHYTGSSFTGVKKKDEAKMTESGRYYLATYISNYETSDDGTYTGVWMDQEGASHLSGGVLLASDDQLWGSLDPTRWSYHNHIRFESSDELVASRAAMWINYKDGGHASYEPDKQDWIDDMEVYYDAYTHPPSVFEMYTDTQFLTKYHVMLPKSAIVTDSSFDAVPIGGAGLEPEDVEIKLAGTTIFLTSSLTETESIINFTSELNSLINSAPVHMTDSFGNEFVLIEFSVNSTGVNYLPGPVLLENLRIEYDMTIVLDDESVQTAIRSYLDGLVAGNISVPINVSSTTPGIVVLSGLNVQYEAMAPNVINIPRRSVNEDSVVEELYDLWNYFSDERDQTQFLQYKVTHNSLEDKINVTIKDNRFLTVDCLTGTGNDNFTGTLEVKVTAEDTNNLSKESGMIIIDILPVNDRPVLFGIPTQFSMAEDDPEIKIDLETKYVDAENNTCKFNITNVKGSGVRFSIDEAEVLHIQPEENFFGEGQATVEIYEISNRSANDNVTIKVNVSSVNDLPVVTLVFPENNAVITGKDSLRLNWTYSDVENDEVAFDVFFYETLNFGSPTKKDNKETYFNVENLKDGKTYYWAVTPKDPYGDGEMAIGSFEVQLPVIATDVAIDKDSVSALPGRNVEFNISMVNSGNRDMDFKINSEFTGPTSLKNSISLTKTEYSVGPDAEDTLNVRFTIPQNVLPGTYFLNFTITVGEETYSESFELTVLEIEDDNGGGGGGKDNEGSGFLLIAVLIVVILIILMIAVIVIKSRKKKDEGPVKEPVEEETIDDDLSEEPELEPPVESGDALEAEVAESDIFKEKDKAVAKKEGFQEGMQDGYSVAKAKPMPPKPGQTKTKIDTWGGMDGESDVDLQGRLDDIFGSDGDPFSGAIPAETKILALPPATVFEVDAEDLPALDEIFIVSSNGIMIQHFSYKEASVIDEDILSSMLTVIQNFIQDSFDKESELKTLEFGQYKILINNGKHLSVVIISSDHDAEKIKPAVHKMIEEMEETHSDVLENWNGDLSTMGFMNEYVEKLTQGEY